MFNIKNYLEKFSKNLSSSEEQKKQILEIIKKHTETEISLEQVEIKNYIIYIKNSPAVLNRVFIQKNKILEEISLSIPNIKIVDIK